MKEQSDKKILIVDDESEMRIALEETLKHEGYLTESAVDGIDALSRLNQKSFDLVLSDVKMPKMGGPELLKKIRELSPTTLVIMMTAYGTIDNAVDSMKQGAFDYLLKPFSAEILLSTLNRAFLTTPDDKSAPIESNQGPSHGVKAKSIFTQNSALKDLMHFAKNIAYSKSTVFISGETGTGKEMFARFIHQNSPRSKGPFCAINCAALPEGLLESELFGHEKGAFTGAVSKKEGKFELANRGTLLLDEVTEMNLPLQAKLLRVLQEHEIDKVGGRHPIPVDVRVIATTNQNPKHLVEKKTFREDLYYRLNVIPLKLPPLRERKDDIPLLAEHFVKIYAEKNNKALPEISKDILSLLTKYDWRGNVREFENVIERAVLICSDNTLTPKHLFLDDESFKSDAADSDSTHSDSLPLHGTIEEMEKALIHQTLKETEGNKTRAAQQLGISVRTLRNKLNDYAEKDNLSRPDS